MLKMIKGAVINDADKLNEEYIVDGSSIIANVNADKILKLIYDFVDLQSHPLFLIIEVPTSLKYEKVEDDGNTIKQFHKDVYYLDDMSKEFVKDILKVFGNLFVNDGMAQIGVGNHITESEIMTDKYNVVNILCKKEDISKYEELMNSNGIKPVDDLITAWEYFNKSNPGERNSIEEDGKDVYAAVDILRKEAGLYFAERRVDK